jgi:hypothetical protein
VPVVGAESVLPEGRAVRNETRGIAERRSLSRVLF